ncbi:MAG: cupredoxin domain-containing protein [Microthrixaceae bacterium]
MSRHRILIGAFAIWATLALAGCGSSDSSGTAASGGDRSTTTAETKSTAAPVELSGEVNNKGTKDISGEGTRTKVDIEVDDNYFSPTYIQAAPGATVTVKLENEGKAAHTFTLDDSSVDQTLQPGDEATVTVKVPASGSLRFSCNFHGAMGMQGAFFTT